MRITIIIMTIKVTTEPTPMNCENLCSDDVLIKLAGAKCSNPVEALIFFRLLDLPIA